MAFIKLRGGGSSVWALPSHPRLGIPAGLYYINMTLAERSTVLKQRRRRVTSFMSHELLVLQCRHNAPALLPTTHRWYAFERVQRLEVYNRRRRLDIVDARTTNGCQGRRVQPCFFSKATQIY